MRLYQNVLSIVPDTQKRYTERRTHIHIPLQTRMHTYTSKAKQEENAVAPLPCDSHLLDNQLGLILSTNDPYLALLSVL